MIHPTEDELAGYAFDGASKDLEDHLARCPHCAARLTLIRSVDAGLSDPEVWRAAARMETGFRESLADLAEQIAREDEDAEELLEPLLQRPAATAFKNIAQRQKFLTGGVVRLLTEASLEAAEREPLEALIFAEAAVDVAYALHPASYPADGVFVLRGRAQKERANSLRLLGRYDEALEALEEAERAFDSAAVAPLGHATVAHARGIIHYERGEHDQALRLAREAAVEFDELGDRERYLRARHLEANVEFYQQHIRTAEEIYRAILREAEEKNDLQWIARESRTLAHCALELGDRAEAAALFHRSLQAFSTLGQSAEVARTNWGIACLALASGDASAALTDLRRVRAEFARRGMLTDEALVVFDMMDALLALERSEEIAALAADLVRRFTRAGMLTSALTALAYLEESATTGTITPGVVEHVRQFIRQAEKKPDLLFAPPPPTFS